MNHWTIELWESENETPWAKIPTSEDSWDAGLQGQRLSRVELEGRDFKGTNSEGRDFRGPNFGTKNSKGRTTRVETSEG